MPRVKTTPRRLLGSFDEVVRDALRMLCRDPLYMQIAAVRALEAATEAHLQLLFHDAQIGAKHGRRDTVTGKDLKLAQRMRGRRLYC